MVRLESVFKSFGDFNAVNNVSLDVAAGEFLTLLGPSGCGKTTTLRMIAGFEQPTSGDVFIGNERVNGVPPYQRDVNTVFQNYALFPHLTVFDNIAFGLKLKKHSQEEITSRVNWALDLVKLSGLADRRPRQLSGGQQQRVALARAIVCRPRVLLLDEPLGALDLKLRKAMQIELKSLQRQLDMTFIYVTHDQEEALTMSDRIGIMNGGVLDQIDTAATVYEKPQTKFVAEFIGDANLLPARVLESAPSTTWIDVQGLRLPATYNSEARPGQDVWLLVRPENIRVLPLSEQEGVFGVPATPGTAELTGVLQHIVYMGATLKVIVMLQDGTKITAARLASSSVTAIALGAPVKVTWPTTVGHIIVR
jgi:spermidine/putrescine transport system ATP-binding protein